MAAIQCFISATLCQHPDDIAPFLSDESHRIMSDELRYAKAVAAKVAVAAYFSNEQLLWFAFALPGFSSHWREMKDGSL